MQLLKLFMLLQLLIRINGWFCSAYCKPNACSGTQKTHCGDCQSPFVLSGGLCQVDTMTGYSLVAQNTSMTVTPTTSIGSCSPSYLFVGPVSDTQILTVSTSSPVTSQHIKIRFIVWIILINQWKSSDTFTVTNTNTGIYSDVVVTAYNTNQNLCGQDSYPQSFFKFAMQFAHTDTSANVVFRIQMKHTPGGGGSSNPLWGIKQYMILALGCHPYCLTCTNNLQNTCTACKTGYKLSGTTCQSTCLAGYGSTTNATLCVLCDLKCMTCYQTSTNCSACTTTAGVNQAYLYGTQCLTTCPPYYTADKTTHTCLACTNPACLSCLSSNLSICYDCNTTTYWYVFDCVGVCPDGYFQDVQNCTQCDTSCQICSNTPNPCTQCATTYFLSIDQCVSTCPTGQFGYAPTRVCLDCATYCVTATLTMAIPQTKLLNIYIAFNHPINFNTFPYTTFQTINISDTTITLSDFTITYTITSDRSYQIQLKPITNTFSMTNVTFTTDINYYATPFYSADGYQISPDTYDLVQYILWEIPQTPPDNTWELKTLQDINNQINKFFIQPWVQQIKKTGIFALLLPGSQLSSTVLLHNAKPSTIMYEGSRFWGTFVFFQVPQWQKNGSGLNSVFSNNLKNVLNPTSTARVLATQQQQLDWRFARTGHVGYFLFDAYIPIIIIILSWIPIIVLNRCPPKNISMRKYRGYFYTILHKIHQICMFYLILAICLDWFYFQSKVNNFYKYLSLGFSIIFVIYSLIYQIYIFYKIIPYTYIILSSHKFNIYVQKYSYFLRDMRYQQYGIYNRWQCSHFLRPYNYHILSFFRICLILACLPLFQNITYGCISCLIFIQSLQISRFMLTWPFSTNWRNYYKLILQILLLLIFILYLIGDIQYQTNILNTNLYWMAQYKRIGWVGLVIVFIYNILYFIYFIIDIVVGFIYTNRQRMELSRSVYYRKILQQYQTYRDIVNPTLKQTEAQTLLMSSINSNKNGYFGILSSIHNAQPAIDPIFSNNNNNIKQTQKQAIELIAYRGNLCDHDYEKYWTVKVQIQEYQLKQAGQNKYIISYDKVKDLHMHLYPDPSKKYNILMPQRKIKQVKITPIQNQYYFKLVDNIYKHYKNNTTQAVIIRTYLKVDQNLYEPGQRIDIKLDHMNQQIQVRNFNGDIQRQVFKSVLRGFPVPDQLLLLL